MSFQRVAPHRPVHDTPADATCAHRLKLFKTAPGRISAADQVLDGIGFSYTDVFRTAWAALDARLSEPSQETSTPYDHENR